MSDPYRYKNESGGHDLTIQGAYHLRRVRCDAELDEGGLCYGPLMEYTPEPEQARQRGQG